MDIRKKFINLNGRRCYSEGFKKYVVRQVESGKLTKEEAKHKYNIAGNSAVLNWSRKYGKHQYFQKVKLSMSKDKNAEAAYKRRLKELEHELSQSKLRVSYLECVIEVAEEEMGLTIKKKLKSPQLPNVGKKDKKRR